MLSICQSFGKMPLKDAEPATDLLYPPVDGCQSLHCLQSSCYFFRSQKYCPLWCVGRGVWNCGKGAEKLSEQLAILLTVLPKLTSQSSQ